jgi:hypothetical protein
MTSVVASEQAGLPRACVPFPLRGCRWFECLIRKPHRGDRRFVGSEAIGDFVARCPRVVASSIRAALGQRSQSYFVRIPLLRLRGIGKDRSEDAPYGAVKDQSEDAPYGAVFLLRLPSKIPAALAEPNWKAQPPIRK